MTRYIQYSTADGGAVLVEVEAAESMEETTSTEDLVKAGVIDEMEKKTKEVIDRAKDTFEDGLEVVRRNADAFIRKLSGLADPPDEVEVAFGLKATGEAGNFAVAKVGMEANYTVKLVWKREGEKARTPRKTRGASMIRRRRW
jgi:hypothetical protein